MPRISRSPPKPKTTIFDTRDDTLGDIRGPIRVEVIDDVIWATGGHVSVGAVFRHAEGNWTATKLEALPNFVLAVSASEAIVGGVAGHLARTVDGGATWKWERLGQTGDWLICASRDRAGRVWIGQQGGRVWRAADPRAPFEQVAQVRGSVNTVRQISASHAMIVTEKLAHRIDLARGTVKREPLFEVDATTNMIDGAIDDRGQIVLVASGGRAWLAKDGAEFRPVDMRAGKLDFDAVFWLDGWFTVLGYDGALRVSLDGLAWKRVVIERKTTVRRLGGIAAYRDGWLVGASRSDPQLSGTLVYLGNPASAPLVPVRAPTVADDTLTFVVAERYALSWATTWAKLPNAEQHAAAWMTIAATLKT